MDIKKDWMDTKQDWKGLDGAIAWHLIERQAENWNQVGEMMNEWLKANTPTKEWVGLTNNELVDLTIKNAGFPILLAQAIEAKLKKKNH